MALTGHTFGRWEVLCRAPDRHGGRATYWLCRCSCGTEREVNTQRLRDGTSRSCGCYRRENPNRLTHGKARTLEHRIWCGIIYRCENERSRTYRYYGGRGIEVCARWRKSFATFFADMGKAP